MSRLGGGCRGAGRIRALGLLAGVVADAALGDPARWHPVAGFGRLAGALERRCYRDTRSAGALHLVASAGLAVGVGIGLEYGARRAGPAAQVGALGLATWAVLGGRSLTATATTLADRLDAGAVEPARRLVPHLCGRDPATLDAGGMARAGCESVAENTSDAVVAPLVWGAVAGIPGLLGYRAVNTLDAMVGYRSPRYRRFGWAAARTDDVLNLVPSRLTAGLIVLAAPLVGGRPGDALRIWRRDAGGHPSPNAGPVEAAAAGALGVRLGGRTVYPHAVEDRPGLGEGRAPTPRDLRRSARLCTAAGWLSTGLVVAASSLR